MNIVASMLVAQPAPAIVWALLLLISFPAMLLLGSPEAMRHPRRAAQELVAMLGEHRAHRLRQAAAALDAARFAEQLQVASQRATTAAARWRQQWQTCEQATTMAWQAWLDADTRLKHQLAAHAWHTPEQPVADDECADRQAFLHRALTAAAARGELPDTVAADALAGRGSWDARLHPAAQQLAISRASVTWLRERYEQAATAEQTAWHDADLARRAAQSLRREAQTAAAQAAQAANLLPTRQHTTTVTGRRAVPVPAM